MHQFKSESLQVEDIIQTMKLGFEHNLLGKPLILKKKEHYSELKNPSYD